ncbi:DUF3800 domain-containing protein [Rhodopseudomonas palustris]|nr:DUF3800 domain-containing protein [Rhodopseudomonas palustris]
MYVDESGDVGLVNSPTSHFALSGLIVHESRWRHFVASLISFRRTLRDVYGLPLRTELHASQLIKSPPMPGMNRHIRLAILRNFLDELAKMDFVSITNVIVCKAGKPLDYDVFSHAWQALFQRFENTLKSGNFPGSHRNDYGIVLTDATDGRKLQRMVRRMSVYNPVPNMARMGSGHRNLPLLRIIEDPYPKDSKDSFFIQACDTCAYFLLQKFSPNSFVRRAGAHHYLNRLQPVLNRKASYSNELGIVVL